MALVGPGSIKQENATPEPTLVNASEYEYVTILNPLSDDFQVSVAQDIPVNMPLSIHNPTSMVQSERDVVQQYGLQLKNPDHKAMKYIYNQSIIPAGQTMNFKGNEAQVVVRQLTNEILQREGKRRLMADPYLRKEVEDRIIIKRGSVQDILDQQMFTPTEQINSAIKRSNEVKDEPFPGLAQPVENPVTGDSRQETGTGDTPVVTESDKKPVGRPKKADS